MLHLEVPIMLLSPLLEVSRFSSDVHLASGGLVHEPIELVAGRLVLENHVVVSTCAALHLHKLSS